MFLVRNKNDGIELKLLILYYILTPKLDPFLNIPTVLILLLSPSSFRTTTKIKKKDIILEKT